MLGTLLQASSAMGGRTSGPVQTRNQPSRVAGGKQAQQQTLRAEHWKSRQGAF